MTKLEALAKDCIENHTHRLVDKPTKQDIYLREESIFIQGYRQSEKKIADLEQQIEKMKFDVISERDKAKRLEDVITYTVLNNILAKWEIKEND